MPNPVPQADQQLVRLVRALAEGDGELRRRVAQVLGGRGRAAVWPLIAALGDPSPSVRAEAAKSLGMIGADAGEAVRPLSDALVEFPDTSGDVRSAAAAALGTIGPAASVVATLLVALGDRGEDGDGGEDGGWVTASFVQSAGARALGHFGADAAPAVGRLAAMLGGPDDRAREAAAATLARIGDAAVGPMIAALREERTRSAAAGVLVVLGAKAVSALESVLDDGEEEVSLEASKALGRIGREAIGQLITALSNKLEAVRLAAVNGLRAVKGDAAGAVPSLIGMLLDGERTSKERREAALALGDIGVAAKDAVGTLTELLQDPDEGIACAAAEALGRIGEGSEGAVKALIAALADQADESVGVPDVLASSSGQVWNAPGSRRQNLRRAAMEALGRIGRGVPEVGAALGAVLQGHDPSLSRDAAVALGKLGTGIGALVGALGGPAADAAEDALVNMGARAVPVLAHVLNRPGYERLWKRAAQALGRIGAPHVATAILILGARLCDPDCDSYVRIAVANALGTAGPEAVGPLLNGLAPGDEQVRRAVVKALGNIGEPAAPAAVGPLHHLLRHEGEYWGVRQDAVRALGKMGSAAVDALIAALWDPDDCVQLDAVQFLGRLGADSVSAITPLRALSATWGEGMRRETVKTLGKIGLPAIDTLRGFLHDQDWKGLREEAVRALRAMDPLPTTALVEALGHQDETVRWMAAKGLGNACPTEEAVRALVKVLQEQGEEMEGVVSWSLGRLGRRSAEIADPLAEKVVDALSEALGRGCRAAAFALRDIDTEGAVAALHDALGHTNAEVANLAAEALL